VKSSSSEIGGSDVGGWGIRSWKLESGSWRLSTGEDERMNGLTGEHWKL
jgi:hypothetical protein